MDGVYLFIGAKGGKSWHFRFYWPGRQVRISPGSYPDISLKSARGTRPGPTLVAQGVVFRASRKEEHLAACAAGPLHLVESG
ncbi:Arm DNA-binding domain-containing protein [Pseudomonas fluorescens]|uniref:Arm DNA-binding domain-containing protein n=1 Tax=Pseudomonas fluorescens TaxID=294 RepID=UPI003082E1CB